MNDNIDRSWKLYDEGGYLFGVLEENGDDAPSFTFVQDQVGGDGQPMHFTDDALRTVRDAIDEYLRSNVVKGEVRDGVEYCAQPNCHWAVHNGPHCFEDSSPECAQCGPRSNVANVQKQGITDSQSDNPLRDQGGMTGRQFDRARLDVLGGATVDEAMRRNQVDES